MSLVYDMPCSGVLRKVRIVYNFKQVDDTVMLMLYSDKYKSPKNIFIDYRNGFWQTNKINRYTDAATFQQVSSELATIFQRHKQMHEENADAFNLLPDHALLMLSACS